MAIQRLLVPLTCELCTGTYSETGYWQDALYCPACSASMRRQEEERKKELVRKAREIAEKHNLDLDKYTDEIPEEIRREINPKNAGRKAVKYDNAYCELLIEEAGEGKTEAEFAANIKITQATLQYWTGKHLRFKKAREIANELREAWFYKHYRFGMLGKISCVASMMIRYGAAKYGLGDKGEQVLTGGGGEIPVVKIVERDAGFPAETLDPTKEQMQAAGFEEQAG